MSALSLPEVKHMLDVLLGSLSALEELMKVARADKDPSIVRLAVSEAETASKTCVRLSQAISAYAAEHPEEANRNIAPVRDHELDGMRDQFLNILRSFDLDHDLDEHVDNLRAGAWRESRLHARPRSRSDAGGDQNFGPRLAGNPRSLPRPERGRAARLQRTWSKE